jgi:hypothetical protein
MANRFAQQKPDPAMKKDVIRARLSARSGKNAKGLVVAASLAATLAGWGAFAHEDAQVAVTAQIVTPTQVVTTVQESAISTPTVVTTSAQVSFVSQIIDQPAATATATPAASASQSVTPTAQATATPAAVAVTKSSR